MFKIKINPLKTLTVIAAIAGSAAKVIAEGGSMSSIIEGLTVVGVALGLRNAVAKNGNGQ